MADDTEFQEFRDMERSGWTAADKGRNYDAYLGTVTGQVAPFMLDALRGRAGMSLLDVACGPGYVAGEAVARGLTVTGIDFSASMLAVARARVPEAGFEEGDAEALPAADGAFQAVSCAFGLLHFGDPDRAIREAARVLAAGGRYACSVWAEPRPGSFMALVGGAIRRHGDPRAGAPRGPAFFRFADADTGREALAAAGLANVERTEAPLVVRVPAGDVLNCVYAAAVRTAAIMNAQSEAARERIHAEILAGAEASADDGITNLPMPALVYSGRRPG